MSPTATAIPPTHVPCVAEWPALSPSRISSHETDGDWELLSELQDESSTSTSTSAQTQTQTQTSFEREAVRIVEQFLDTENSTASATKITTPFCLKHAQSSPNFHTILEESDDNDAVLVGTTGNSNSNSTSTSQPEDGVGSLASSSMVMVPESPSLVSTESSWSTVSKISFRDAIMKEKPQETNHNANNNNNNKDKDGTFSLPSVAMPVGIALIIAQMFSSDITETLKIAGAFGSPILYGLIPVTMALMQQQQQQQQRANEIPVSAEATTTPPTIVPGGIFGLGALALGSAALIGTEVLQTCGTI
mmetsp:Transcript_6088/g.14143  ORF Transcript_6088/g.14143 Transcript_6088/m.14143 type:complete len:305 (+) Transcript_6088:221-1135(+)